MFVLDITVACLSENVPCNKYQWPNSQCVFNLSVLNVESNQKDEILAQLRQGQESLEGSVEIIWELDTLIISIVKPHLVDGILKVLGFDKGPWCSQHLMHHVSKQ
jgi:hypothetical protein